MVLSEEAIIGLVVLPIALLIIFVLLVMFHISRSLMWKIMEFFWSRQQCMCCKMEICRRKQARLVVSNSIEQDIVHANPNQMYSVVPPSDQSRRITQEVDVDGATSMSQYGRTSNSQKYDV